MSKFWSAPRSTRPVVATVVPPGSKSATNRALVIAALSAGESAISGALVARDTELMISGLASLGVGFQREADKIRVRPQELRGPAQIDCGLAGTVMRFLPPVAALARGAVRFDGDAQARRRPMSAMLDALRALGVDVVGDSLPFELTGTGSVAGGEVRLNAAESSQFISGLLLPAARYDNGLTVHHVGPPLPSRPHVGMTLRMLQAAGADVSADVSDPADCSWDVRPGSLNLGEFAVEPDLSNAAVFLAAAMVTSGVVTVPNWPKGTTQAGDQIRAIFAQMGADCALGSNGLALSGPSTIRGIDTNLQDVGELTPTIAAVCLFAEGPSHLRGIGHLRGHETDRIAALVHEINRLGGAALADEDSIRIDPRPLTAASVDSYADHRMATFGAVVGLRVPGVRVVGIGSTAKTMPDFVDLWERTVAGAE